MKFIVELTISSGIVRKINYEVVDEGESFYVIRNSHKGYQVVHKDGVHTSYEKIPSNKPGIYYVLQEISPITDSEFRKITRLQKHLEDYQESKDKLLNLRKEVDIRIESLDNRINRLKESLMKLQGGNENGRYDESDTQKTS